jgi:hypothetical protein
MIDLSDDRDQPMPPTVGAVEPCEAAKAVCQANRYRSLALLGSSYKILCG